MPATRRPVRFAASSPASTEENDPMRAILINAYDRTVSESTVADGDYRDIYRALSTPEHAIDTFTVIDISERHRGHGETIFVDDEGLLKDPSHFFLWRGYGQPLAGNGLILGVDHSTGESESTRLTVESVADMVTFVDNRTIEFVGCESEEHDEIHPDFGPVHVHRSIPVSAVKGPRS